MSDRPTYRFDSAATSVPPRTNRRVARVKVEKASVIGGKPDSGSGRASGTESTFSASGTESTFSASGTPADDWLRLHAAELIDHLQAWSMDLDAREAQLNSRSSHQDHRERQFRLIQQDATAELAEKQRAIDRIRTEIHAQARRMAFGGHE
ncbi:hypothetical protein Poly51_19700 [Rubripirellula tenax]|uniref:Uncharacterized protein n=1 Tax=Rubripirellula tenax TaxID=2528015 RepID=A0A5C6FG77_9BACT|nr:hypothetical protein [Rubripirellula tenax]TWU59184.1 hypothetical protein Poly51_19700 [Rubripirellula tenax]